MSLLLGIFLWKRFKFNDVPAIGVLKNDITALIRPESKTLFRIHDHLGLRYLFQLRLTSLIPQDIEDTSHFLFSCPHYATPRVTLLPSVNQILKKISLNHIENQ